MTTFQITYRLQQQSLSQQLQNMTVMLYQCPSMSHLSGLLIFDLSNTEHEENQVLLIQELPTISRDFSPTVLLKTGNCIYLAYSIPQNTVFSKFSVFRKKCGWLSMEFICNPIFLNFVFFPCKHSRNQVLILKSKHSIFTCKAKLEHTCFAHRFTNL